MSYTPLSGFQSPLQVSGTTEGNSTATALGAGATFTGDYETNALPDVLVSLFSDTAGTLYFDFSVNGSDARTFPPNGFTVTAGVHEFHTALKGPRQFRVRFVNSGGAQTTFQLYTYFGWFSKTPNAPIGFTIADDADATVTKSVISGVGDTTATVTDHKALQVTPPPESKSAFGEFSVAELSPMIQLKFPYDYIEPIKIKSRPNQSGTVSAANSLLTMTTGAAANSSGTFLTKDVVTYRPGQGIVSRFTAIFTPGVANSSQIIGIGDHGEGFFFGYNGASFGVMSRKDGLPEIRTLTVTTASSDAEDITITLDGDAKSDVTVTASGVITTTCNEIAAADYSDVGDGWDAIAVGDTVVFTSWTDATKTGTYSLSSATSAVGTFAQTLAGVTAVDTWVAQASWNGADKFDGNGITGVTLDPTKGNVFAIKFQFLGFGAIHFFIEDPDDGEFHRVHTIEYSNANTTPSLNNPSLPLCGSVRNGSNTSNLTMSTASVSAFGEGVLELIGPRRGVDAAITLGATAAETPITTIRSTEVFKGTLNRTTSKILLIGASADHTKPVGVKFYLNAVLTGSSFSSIDSNSTIQQDTAATAFSGGVYLFTIELGKDGNEILDVTDDDFDFIFQPGDSLTATIAPKSGNSAEATVSFYIVELF